MINEEVASILLRKENRRLVESIGMGGSLQDLDATELLDFAEAYVSMGAAVQEQLRDLLDNQEDADINPNALDVIEQAIGGMNNEIDEAIEAWKSTNV